MSSASEKASLVDELDSILETTRIIRININFESLVCCVLSCKSVI